MTLNLLLLFVFATSGMLVRRSMRSYAPRLTALSEHEITQRLHEDSARLLLILMHFRTFWRGRHYRNFFLHLAGKLILKSHILILRLDNTLVRFLQKIRETGAFANGASGMGEYLRQLKSAPDNSPSVVTPVAPRRRVRVAVSAASYADGALSEDQERVSRTSDAVRIRHRTLHLGPKLEEGLRDSPSRPSRVKVGQ